MEQKITKKDIRKKELQLLKLTSDFCKEKLDENYLILSAKAINNLGSFDDIPYLKGQIELWAAGIIHALGSINFLFEESVQPHVTKIEISEYFGVKKSNISSKSSSIQRTLGMQHFGSEYSTQRIKKEDTSKDFVKVDGRLVHLTTLPPDLQEYVKNERANGKHVEFDATDE